MRRLLEEFRLESSSRCVVSVCSDTSTFGFSIRLGQYRDDVRMCEKHASEFYSKIDETGRWFSTYSCDCCPPSKIELIQLERD